MNAAPTTHPAVNSLLHALYAGMREVLGDDLLGLYLDGSIALGGFDGASDIDFVALVVAPIAADDVRFARLQTMHDRVGALTLPLAREIEGAYVTPTFLRAHAANDARHPNIERGPGERLKMVDHDPAWDVHRFVLREHGVALHGLPPRALIESVAAAQLQASMRSTALPWLAGLADDPSKIATRGYQSYIVLTVCRVWHTLARGAIVSKRDAARWAQSMLGEPWVALIERAWVARAAPDPANLAAADDIRATARLIRHMLATV
jgi:hypothetical protein